MSEDENVETETTENTEVEAEATESEVEEESVEEVRARLAKAEELAKNYKIRAEKAEGKSKETKAPEANTGGLSTKDTIAIMQANVHVDDIDEVVEYAKFKKISVSDALRSSVIKTELAQKAEERKTAEVTNTGTGRRSAVKISDQDLLNKAVNGDIPESDSDIERVVRAKFAKK